MNLDLYYVVKELRYSGNIEEYQYAAGPFSTRAIALDEKQERNADFGVDTFDIVTHSIEVELK